MADNHDFFDAMISAYFNPNPYVKHLSLNGNDAYINNIDRIICNPPATIIIWKNGNKSIVKCMDTDIYIIPNKVLLCVS